MNRESQSTAHFRRRRQLLLGAGAGALAVGTRAVAQGAAKPLQVAMGLLPIALLSLRWQGSSPMHLDHGMQHQAVSDYVAAHTTANETVYQDQIGRLLIETDRSPGSRYGTFFYFINYDQAPLDFCNGMIADFQARKPKYIIEPIGAAESRQTIREPILDVRPVRRQNFLTAGKMYESYLRSHYFVETVIEGNNVFRRKEVDTGVAGVQ